MTKFRSRWSAPAALALMLAVTAHAVELETGVLRVEPNQLVTCIVTHFAKIPQDLTVELVDGFNGSARSQRTCFHEDPARPCDIETVGVTTLFVFCRVTASSRSTVRGLIQNLATGSTAEAR